MKDFDKVSVIVPVYNAEKYLCKCVDSIVAQTYPNLEILLIDDGSTDKSPEICDEYQERNKIIKVIHKKNGGVSSARNVGIEISTGKYVCFIDADDYVDRELVFKLRYLIGKDEKYISLCELSVIEESLQRNLVEDFDNINDKSIIVEKIATGRIFGSACRCIYPKSIITDNNIKFKNIIHCEDQLFFVEAILGASQIKVIREPLYYYRKNLDSGAKLRYYNDFLIDRLNYFNEFNRLIDKLYIAPKRKRKIKANIIINLKQALYFNAVLSKNMKEEINCIDKSLIGRQKTTFTNNLCSFCRMPLKSKIVYILIKLRFFRLLRRIRMKKSK